MDKAFTHSLWAAAYIIGGGCSDDAFADFRATLISHGRATFERVLKNPETLADMDLTEETAFYEGFQYVVTMSARLTGALPKRSAIAETTRARLGRRPRRRSLPDLAEKYGFEV